ncbi:transmembrane protein 248 isoform X2 [Hoplias malabaricus]|uniref:transmembrane protein 248 isoform X2 n=1 Tax=Hoplias malabaricus TaxID=27720 RepID=UPI003462A388
MTDLRDDDWNQMLGSILGLKFCTHLNSTDILNRKQVEDSPPLLNHEDGSVTNTSQKAKETVTLSLLVPLVRIGGEPNHNSISATLHGYQLGLKGSSGKEMLNITLFLSLQTQLSKTESVSALDLDLPTPAEANPKSLVSCLRITAPAHLLPQTPTPPACLADNLEAVPPVKAIATDSYKQTSQYEPPCLSLRFTPDHNLTVNLTQEEKALARYHLMLVSVALLAVCCMMCLIGSLTCSRSWRHMENNLHSQKENLLRP